MPNDPFNLGELFKRTGLQPAAAAVTPGFKPPIASSIAIDQPQRPAPAPPVAIPAPAQAPAQVGRQVLPDLPEIFKSILPMESGASRITGFDPKNPPSVHTLTEQQFMSLNPAGRQQYKQFTERRKRMIETARLRQREFANIGIQHNANKRSSKILSEDFKRAAVNRSRANELFGEVRKKSDELQLKISNAIHQNWMVRDPNTGLFSSDNIPSLADGYNRASQQMARDMELARSGQESAEADFLDAQIRASNAGLSAFNEPESPSTSAAPAIAPPAQSGGKVLVVRPDGVRGHIPKANLQKALERGYRLVQ